MRKRLFLPLLALCLCLLVSGCGQASAPADDAQKDTQTTTGSPAGDGQKSVEECYIFNENKDGTYSYFVSDRQGALLGSQQNRPRPTSSAVMTDDVLVVFGQDGTGIGARWAKFYNVETKAVSEMYRGFLSAMDQRVAYVDMRTGEYRVFVSDQFDPTVYCTDYVLEGAVVPESGDIIEDFKLSKDGVLTITYPTASGSKTIEVLLTTIQPEK